ncbi:DUF3617 domain-containing protein [Parasphingopyxis algicola]|uniref:DUF3617 domain-containing protein n=1 Tax=Parasphingopyxis algicola TaxID=2026624 RepID=UPI0015A4DB0D|nr:DUF3617 domain-containing protein [Parasphingopyxis algicola]QLC25837.1 DUF3617 domain-containing protein [Parasphingopyxis algicola]
MTNSALKTLIACAAPMALLAACSSGGDADADGDGEISSAEAAAEMESAGANITPGQWEATVQLTEFDMPDMPEDMRGMMQEQMGRAQTNTSCITPEEAAAPEANMFGDGDDCTYSEFDMSGGTILIAGTCQSEGMPGAMTMRMEGSYTPTSYDMTMNMNMDGGPMGPMTMAGQVNGRFLGPDCATDADG